ncbi:MAG TPA: hypothetical protein VGD52_27120 [Pseudoduganella sp.]
MVDEVILRPDKLDHKGDKLDAKLETGLEKLNDKIDANQEDWHSRFYKLYLMLVILLATLVSGLLALLAKAIGAF